MWKHGSLFSGIGGFDQAAQWMGWHNVFHCEFQSFPQTVLNYYWPKAISYENIITTDFTLHRNKIHVLTGGFPCQPFSNAGSRMGTDDNRYLWPQMLRAIREIQPIAVVGENVTGILNMEQYEVYARVDSRSIVRFEKFDQFDAVYTRQRTLLVNDICKDLEQEGYKVQPLVVPAASVNAPHRRDRIWFVAYSDGAIENYRQRKDLEAKREVRGHEEGNVLGELSGLGAVADTEGKGSGKLQNQKGAKRPQGSNELFRGEHTVPNWDGFPTQSPVCGGNDGLPTELHGIALSDWIRESRKGYGNAIVPQVAMQIFGALQTQLKIDLKAA